MPTKPNILLIVADDLGFSDLSSFGSEIPTPNIDRLQSHNQGLRFTDFHTASACSPTRSMLLSGTDNHIAGLGAMLETIQEFQRNQPGYEGYLNDRVAALPEILRDAGYYTWMSGKWHLGLQPQRWPCARGFQRSFSLLPGAANHYGWEPQLEEEDEERPPFMQRTNVFYVEDDRPIAPADLHAKITPNADAFYSTDAFADKALEYLTTRTDAQKQQPFFGYLAFSAPHWPLQAPPQEIAKFAGRYDNGPLALRAERIAKLKKAGLVPEHAVPHEIVTPPSGKTLSKDWAAMDGAERAFSARCMEVYVAMVHRMDAQIGRVLDELERSGELDDTFVVFMSDNGAEGMLLEAIPIVRGGVFEYIDRYYDNSVDNVGRYNSYVWYGPHWASAATAPARLYKGFTSEGGIRVPFLVRYPPLTTRKQRKGEEQTANIEHVFATVMDLLPTILDLAGVTHPAPTFRGREVVAPRGKSWVPYLTARRDGAGDTDVSPIHDTDHTTGWELFGRQAVRKGRWKILLINPPYGPGTWQLFDLEADPGETRVVGGENPGVLGELVGEWEGYVREVGVAMPMSYGTLKVGDDREGLGEGAEMWTATTARRPPGGKRGE